MALSCEEVSERVQSSAPMPTDPQKAFRAALTSHYKTERDRSESCLGDIIRVLQNTQPPDVAVDKILACLIQHYQRS